MKEKKVVSQYDKMTKTPVSSLVLKLSIPTIISMLVTNIYNVADTAFVGQLGNSASGAVGVVFGYMAIIQAIGFMFGQGAGSLISRMLGKKDTKEATSYASTGFFCALFLGILLSVGSIFILDHMVFWLGSTETIAPYAKTYIRFIIVAAPFMVTSFVMNNFLRYEGKAALGMIGLMLGSILNIAGDVIFMFGLKMGIAGAGLSTALSQIVSFCILLSMFLRGKTQSKLSIRYFAWDIRKILDIIGTGLPSLLRQGLNSLATVFLNGQAAVYGDVAVAAMSIVSRIGFFVFSVALGIGQGFQPVSGFNYGAGKYARLRKAFRFTVLTSQVLVIVMCSVVIVLAPELIRIFRDDVSVVEIGTRALRLHCMSMVVMPFCMAAEMQLQSTGRKLGAGILSSLRGGVIFIPALLLLAQWRGLAGIQEAQPLAYVLSLFPSIWLAYLFFQKLPKEDQAEE